MKVSSDKFLVKGSKSKPKPKLDRVHLVVEIWGVKYKIYHGSLVEVPSVGPFRIADSVTWYCGRVISIKVKCKMILVRYRRRWLYERVDRVDVEVVEKWFKADDIKGVTEGPFPY